jgi:hypothetical protein
MREDVCDLRTPRIQQSMLDVQIPSYRRNLVIIPARPTFRTTRPFNGL